MKKRFPGADLGMYFAFLGCAAAGTYRHHIAPCCEFPELKKDSENIVLLCYDDHRTAHQILSEAVPGHTGFRTAALNMFKQSGLAFVEASRRGGNSAVQTGQLAEARKIMAESGYPQLARARKKMGQDGMCRNLAKARTVLGKEGLLAVAARGRASQAKAGHPQIAKARALLTPEILAAARAKSTATNAHRGWQCFVKGRITSATKGWPHAKRAGDLGRTTQASMGYSNLKKGLHIRWHVKQNIVNPNCGFCIHA